ncbi:glycoside hydrolase family 88 protein [Zunongwangia sp. F363]|uniref:Glycoside hydrolase family 88 protein n=1 Tax=Autumnicola tepida TaxID=3075595 RepID=A0ABU3C7F7_9FLAO|nr:glycoside hydrolase family 88 protein [Zunongwangia sp. F363]MDT0642279.1 glycoside hydrolase family 88 protein [Zunongwangia sp. F363]
MARSSKVAMSFDDAEGLYPFLAKVKSKIQRKDKEDYKYFNFPRAYLLNGLLDVFDNGGDKEVLITVEKEIKKIIDASGNLHFKFDKIDQSLFGVILSRLYLSDEKESYSKALSHIEHEVKKFINDEQDLILYRKGIDVCFVDTLGMVCPFLYTYGSSFQKEDLIRLANEQLYFYIKNGTDKSGLLPFHAVDLKNKIHLGPTNWGRGIGWFMIGLAFSLKYTTASNNPHYKLFRSTFEELDIKLQELKIKNLHWSQFLGHTNDTSIDTSITLMLYYARTVSGKEVKIKEVEKSLQDSINKEGYVLNSSGDTIYINKYATKKGKSELTQGLLLSLIANTN